MRADVHVHGPAPAHPHILSRGPARRSMNVDVRSGRVVLLLRNIMRQPILELGAQDIRMGISTQVSGPAGGNAGRKGGGREEPSQRPFQVARGTCNCWRCCAAEAHPHLNTYACLFCSTLPFTVPIHVHSAVPDTPASHRPPVCCLECRRGAWLCVCDHQRMELQPVALRVGAGH